MRNNKGFTLIELVVVIVILGILAATAAPKFMDLQKDAKTSAIHGLQGAVKSAANIAGVKTAQYNTINTYDIVNADSLVIVKNAVAKIEEVYA